MKGGHGQTNQLHDINWGARDAYWGALDHASRAPQLMSCCRGSQSLQTLVAIS